MRSTYSLSLLTGNHATSCLRVEQFAEMLERHSCSGNVGCKSGRYPKIKRVVDGLTSNGLNLSVHPIASRADFTYFLTKTEMLFLDDTSELHELLNRGWLQLPMVVKP